MSGSRQGPVMGSCRNGKLLDLETDHLFLESLFHRDIYN
jgi:hypothetical protein